jgi:hypothetical protein
MAKPNLQSTSTAVPAALAAKAAQAVQTQSAAEPPDLDAVGVEDRTEFVRRTAYAFYEERGCVDGHDIEDWLRAESMCAESRGGQ